MVPGIEITVKNTTNNTQIVRQFRKQVVRIGRGDLNDLQIEEGFVSQFHAVIELSGTMITLRDLGSTNGSIVNGVKYSSQTVALGEGHGVFCILSLVLTVRCVASTNIPSPASKRKKMAVTGLLEGPPAGLLDELVEASKQKQVPAEQAELLKLYAAYREAWGQLRGAIQNATMTREPGERGPFLTKLSSEFPGVTHEPDFHNMAAAAGSRQLAMRNFEKEKAIALEGLKELSTEYVPEQVPPESAEEIVTFLTRIRGVLDVFFRAFPPLRDGQRQFEQELSIHALADRSGQKDPVSTADSPRALAAALLSLRPSSDDPIGVVESTFADIMINYVAILNGVMKGVSSLLNEISPDAVREFAEQLVNRGVLSKGFGGNHKLLWSAFERRHADLTGEEKHLFGVLFGSQFSRAYVEAAVVTPDQGKRGRHTMKPGDI